MKVLNVSHCGLMAEMREKSRLLAEKSGFEITVLTPPWWVENLEKVTEKPEATSRCKWICEDTWFTNYQNLHFYKRLACHLEREAPDLIHLDEEPFSAVSFQVLWLKERLRLKAKVVMQVWENLFQVWSFPNPRAFLYPNFERFTIPRVDGMIAAAPDAEKVIRQKGFRGPVEVMPQYGIDASLFCKQSKESAQRPVIGFVGRFIACKGMATLLEAASRLKQPFELILMGDGPERKKMEALADHLSLRDRVRFTGTVSHPELPQWLNRLDVLIFPSEGSKHWAEQFGRVAIEAMACEVPVLGSDCGSIPYVIGDGGRVFEAGHVEALCKQLERLLHDAELRAQLGKAGRARVLAEFTQEKIVEKTCHVYEKVLA